MKELKFRVWSVPEKKMYFRGYQKLLHVLLCERDPKDPDGPGKPVRRAPYGDCLLLESTGLLDKKGREVFEGDILRVRHAGKEFTGTAGAVPDMFGSRKLHPLLDLLAAHGITGNPDRLELEVLGNEYEDPALLEERT